jgi:hypothetical protein
MPGAVMILCASAIDMAGQGFSLMGRALSSRASGGPRE